MQHKSSITSIQDLLQHVQYLQNQLTVTVTVLYLDKQKRPIRQKSFQTAKISASKIVLTAKAIYEPALRNQAYFIAIIHYRVTNRLYPNKALIKQVQVIEKIGSYLGVRLLDYLLTSTKDYFSFRENSLLHPLK